MTEKIVFSWQKTCKYAISLAGVFLLSTPVLAEFVGQDFREETSPLWRFSGVAVLTAAERIDPPGGGWLRLTPNEGFRVGKALYQESFASSEGIVVQFDYVMWGMGAYDKAADGISFFLYDPSIPNAMEDATNGAGLGYCNGTGGILGIGLDAGAGSFALRKIDPSFCNVGLQDSLPNAITIRGPLTDDNAFIGQPHQLSELIYNPTATSRPSQTRSVLLSMVPLGGSSGYHVTLDEGPTGGTMTRLIDGNYVAPLPERLSIGFGGGTGSSSQVNEVRINSVALPMAVRLTTTPPVQNGNLVTHTFTLTNMPLVGGSAVPITDELDAPLLSETTDPDLQNIRWTCTPSGANTTCPRASGIGKIQDLGNYLLGETGSLTFTVTGTVPCSTDAIQAHTVTAIFPAASNFDNANPGDIIATASGPVTTNSCSAAAPTPVPFLGHLTLVVLSLTAAGLGAIGLRRRTVKTANQPQSMR